MSDRAFSLGYSESVHGRKRTPATAKDLRLGLTEPKQMSAIGT
jgi:hypothetical protein